MSYSSILNIDNIIKCRYASIFNPNAGLKIDAAEETTMKTMKILNT